MENNTSSWPHIRGMKAKEEEDGYDRTSCFCHDRFARSQLKRVKNIDLMSEIIFERSNMSCYFPKYYVWSNYVKRNAFMLENNEDIIEILGDNNFVRISDSYSTISRKRVGNTLHKSHVWKVYRIGVDVEFRQRISWCLWQIAGRMRLSIFFFLLLYLINTNHGCVPSLNVLI